MLKWKIEDNVIKELYLKNNNIINPWGFETADSSSFFSLEEGIGWRYQIEYEKYISSKYKNEATLKVNMKEGSWNLFVIDELDNNSVTRKVSLKTLEDSVFMDFVMRFRFKKEVIEYAEIAGNKFWHRNTNIYYQYPVDNVYLKGKGFGIKINVIDSITHKKFLPVIYIRDNINEWVVHIRMVPKTWDKEVIKICTKWAATRPLPQWLSNIILKNNAIKKMLWYRGERSPFRSKIVRRFLNPAAFGMIKISKDEELMWHVKMGII